MRLRRHRAVTGWARRAVAADVQRAASKLPRGSLQRVLAEAILGETERRLSAPSSRGTVWCCQIRARLVRALYERLDRLHDATPAHVPAF
ncbi:hypothetical protein [Streptomyces sp. NPDC059122]|uniref:hypothetical protein n=1 Tax=Streptomyces sp. NPDC059122 TaxID=3346732 RepID=UPI0036B2B373